MSFISQPEVCFIAFYSEIMLHGMYTVLFLMTMYLLVFTRKKSRLQIVLSIVTLAMYGIATAHSALYLKQVLETFMNAESSGSFDLNEVSSPIEYTKVALEVINCTIADSVFLWRAWILSGKNTWCCLVPCGLLLGSAVAGFGMVYESSKANGSIVFLRQVAGHWTISWVTLTLTTNIVITGLVTYQAWNLRRQSGPTMANSVLFRLIECGILYSLSFIVLLILFVVGLNASYVLNHMIPQITASSVVLHESANADLRAGIGYLSDFLLCPC
ncbi:hypothetical protein EW146_g1624 [Bondarzewia mesenterica]|uniref:Uncharacterized protein n=1 Tax=Bondarzewia mesenterica TaxID=1095465 RepID=A0A4S4M5J6_9AGAM|nr:hypothetical protein EW146_g1624 [Bondarzewia mesenterica]